jgi:hypothetical protein
MKDSCDGRIPVARWLEIQENAKAAAKEAITSGKTDELTALGKGYYEKYTGVRLDAVA